MGSGEGCLCPETDGTTHPQSALRSCCSHETRTRFLIFSLCTKGSQPPGGPRQTPCELLRGACLCQVYRPTIAGQVAPEPGTRRLVWPHLAWARSRGTFAKSWIRASKGGRGIC